MAFRQSAATFSSGTSYKVTFVILMYLDLVLTLFALSIGFTEMNPIMADLQARPAGLLVVKVLMPPLIAWLVPAKLLLPSIGLLFAVVGWNAGELLVSS